MALSSPHLARAVTAVTSYSSIDEYYSTVPTCAVQCEKDYWSVRVNSPTCGGDGTKFSCFCSNSVLSSTDQIFTLGDARTACFKKECPESEFNKVDLATIRLTAFCSKLLHPSTDATSATGTGVATGTKATGTAAGTNTATGTGSAATPSPSSKAPSFSPSKSLVVFGSLFVSLALFVHV